MDFLLPVVAGLYPDSVIDEACKMATERGRRHGEARGLAAATAIILESKRIRLTRQQRVRLEDTLEPELQLGWFRAALHATNADEVFA